MGYNQLWISPQRRIASSALKTVALKTVGLYTALLGATLGVGCTNKLAPLAPLQRQISTSSVAAPEYKTVKFQTNYCADDRVTLNYINKYIIVMDRSGSNQYKTTGSDFFDLSGGTDPQGIRRFRSLETFLTTGLSARAQANSVFSLVNFSDVCKYARTEAELASPLPPACTAAAQSLNGYKMPGSPYQARLAPYQWRGRIDPTMGLMDRVLNRRRTSPPSTPPAHGVSFASVADFLPILQAETVSPTEFVNAELYGSTDYTRGFAAVQDIISADLGRIESLIQTDPSTPRPVYIVVFITDGAPFRPVESSTTLAQTRLVWNPDIKAAMDGIKTVIESKPQVVMDYQIHGVHYWNQPGGSPTWQCVSDNYDSCPSELIKQVAKYGRGSFFSVYDPSQTVPYSQFIFPTQTQGFRLLNFFLVNENLVWWDNKLEVSSAGDGLPDRLRMPLTTPPPASLGISDFVRYRICGDGSLNCSQLSTASCSALPRTPSGAYLDTDNDGLNDCEEQLLGSNRQAKDSNGDLISDAVAFKKGIAFRANEEGSFADSDWDAVNNGLELKLNLPVLFPNDLIRGLVSYQYSVTETDPSNDNACYLITVDKVQVSGPADRLTLHTVEAGTSLQAIPIMKERSYEARDF